MNHRPQITLSKGEFKDQSVIFIHFEFDWNIVKVIRSLPDAEYKPDDKCWWIPESSFDLEELKKRLGKKADVDASILIHKPTVPKEYLAVLKRRRYSVNTINTYTKYFEDFIDYFSDCDLSEINADEINKYILELIESKSISSSQQNQRINAIKFYYEKVLGRKTEYYKIERPFKEKRLPDVLSKEEIKRILDVTHNLKHKCIISLIYSTGVRRNELIRLKISDIDSKRMLIKVRGAKGKKDRYTILSGSLLHMLREYFKQYHPVEWLFEGPGNKPYSASSMAKILKSSAKNAGISRRIHIHMLRHSFATHLLEQGTNIRIIQELLGHESIQTTEIYTHIANNDLQNVVNPIDSLLEDTG